MDHNHMPFRFRGRGGRRTVLPSYPHPKKAETSSSISGSSAENRDDTPDDENQRREFYPSVEDVSQVRKILCRVWPAPSSTMTSNPRNVMLPDEVIDIILDEAEYWPSVVTKLDTIPFVIAADGDRECLKTPSLCYSLAKDKKKTEDESSSTVKETAPQILLHRGIHPCRKIIFDISSHDQGWGGENAHIGGFTGSWTWFDAYIRPSNNSKNGAEEGRRTSDSTTSTTTTATDITTRSTDSDSSSEGPASSRLRPFLPEPTKLQCNRTATINSTDYHIVWHYLDDLPADSPEAEKIERQLGRGRATLDGSAVRNMKVGDEVSVWLRARFAHWRNHVDKMSVRVFWAA